MRYLYCLIFLLIVAASGCSKSGSNTTNDPYTVTGDSDISVRQYADTSVTAIYHVAFPAGIYEPVTLNISGLPPGVTVSPATATDTTSFSVSVTYHILMTAVASFPVTITIFSGSFGQKTFQFNIIVKPNTPFSYTLSSLHDLSIPLYADTILHIPVTATYTAGVNEPVTIAPGTPPAGVTLSPITATGLPPFTDTLAIHIVANTTAPMPVTLFSSSSQGTMVSAFNINVVAASDCAQPLPGNYSVNTACTSYTGIGTGIGAGQVYIDGTNKLLIHFPLANVVADLNCGSGTLNIEATPSGSTVITAGTGTFNATTIIINYSMSGSINDNCTTTLTR